MNDTIRGYELLEKISKPNIYMPAIDELLQQDCNLNIRNSDGMTALMVAAEYGHTEVVQKLLALGADPLAEMNGSAGITAITRAVAADKPDAFTLLLPYEPDPAARLRQAVWNGRKEIVGILLEYGVSPFTKGPNGQDAFDCVASFMPKPPYAEILKMMRDHVEKTTTRDRQLKHGITPHHQVDGLPLIKAPKRHNRRAP